MKILHIIVSLGDGGAEGVLYRLCSYDKKNDHLIISLRGKGKYGSLLGQHGIEVECLNMPKGRLTLQGANKVRQIIQAYNPDVLQTWMYHADLMGGIIGYLSGIEKICWGVRHSNLDLNKNSFSTFIIARLNAIFSFFIPNSIISCSAEAGKVHKKIGYRQEKFVTIPNGYNLEKFRPDDEKREKLLARWRLPNDMPVLGMVARFHPQKDHANLLAALAIVKRNAVPMKCILVGKNLTYENVRLIKWLNEYDLQDDVILLGQRSNIHEILNAIDLKVLSSLGEGFPNVLAEAMACGTPCVSTNVGDAEFVIGGTGWIVPPRDSNALAGAIIEALDAMKDEVAWRQRKKIVRERICENFSIESMADAFDREWRK